ncbi:hypothetical protein PPYR_07642 [Photinus pyralis]|uniref:UBR-type domain-containing protein n=1 Tax=Photinus pyralis TaxID=7054 RepID=A0A1Y1MVQ1_PHOPY|nr:putative E3 ubiquitin-protein ligase UBR7 [Photinus pyralis]XP_031339240.1 putative E3 ubiquitin-protein ligase UBR7 [Photinus pyralis]KAB0799755.1 hypothetical protein PPYR_07635 [Photinus pyralis]KAB0799762.1 hypothetical protein PPYR_07642 [Photinus pyralis]
MSEENNTTLNETVEDPEQSIVTLGEVLQSEQEMIDDVNAVLGAIDDKKCTYSEGYMKRQALYSCLTCIPEAKSDITKAAGVCLGCCFHCHEGHELVELYTKRNFRCDCGNTKFANKSCKLETTKTDANEFNEYNQNFCGTYCSCNRPYPDPEDSVEDEMIQCILCEDWYHTRHLGVEFPRNVSYAEMCCESCIKQHPFLLYYGALCVKAADPNAEAESKEDEKDDNEVDVAQTDEKTDKETCTKPKDKSGLVTTKFWTDIEWRKQLCTCPECIQIYEEEKVMFLLDPQDTVHVYEEKGKAKAREFEEKQQENGMKFLNSLSRVPLMEALAGYNDMKQHLIEYLKKFAENKKVVREEDIHEFFSNYDAKKKQKSEVPHFCG